MTTYDLTTLPTDTAIKLVMKDFGFGRVEAAHFVALAQGKSADDVISTKAAKLPKLGTGARFAKLEGKLEKKGIKDPGALAASIGRKKFGNKKFAKLSAAGKAYGGLGLTNTGSGNKKTGSLGLTKMGAGSRKTGSLGNTVFGGGNRKTGATGMLKTGSGSAKTGSLGLTKISTLAIQAGGIDKPHNANGGPKFFKPGRKINLLLGKSKGYDPKA